MYLLDTNHSSKLIDGHPDIVRRLKSLANSYVSTCVIVRGELAFMVERSERREENIVKLRNLLRGIDIHPIDTEAADIYGELKAAIFERFGPKARALRRRTKLESLGFTENDLWIAAIAIRQGLVVVSTDSDFARIAEAYPSLNWESWLVEQEGGT